LSAPDRETLRALAEDPPSPPLPPGSASRRVAGDGYTAEIGPQDDPDMNIVSRLRLDGRDLASVVASSTGDLLPQPTSPGWPTSGRSSWAER
jgi:hypothetical protein